MEDLETDIDILQWTVIALCVYQFYIWSWMRKHRAAILRIANVLFRSAVVKKDQMGTK